VSELRPPVKERNEEIAIGELEESQEADSREEHKKSDQYPVNCLR
jgi:hypothetical protein